MNPDIPTGNSDQAVQQYFNHLYSYYLDRMQQNYYIHWDILFGVAFWIVVLVAFFFFYTRWQRNTSHRKEPYPVESYNGYIQPERERGIADRYGVGHDFAVLDQHGRCRPRRRALG